MPKTLSPETYLERIHTRLAHGAANGVATAGAYLEEMSRCAGDETCAARFLGMASAGDWRKAMKEAANRLVYHVPGMRVLGGVCAASGGARKFGTTKKLQGLSEGSILDFEAIITTPRKDHDDDVLESAGAIVDPAHPLLWQHIPFQPIGRLLQVVQQNRKRVTGAFAVAGTQLGQDAAVLAEFGALRISHGFKPLEVERLEDDDEEDGGSWHRGFHVKRFEILETSLVSIPANQDAVITALSRGKLHHPLNKAWAGSISSKRTKVHKVGWDPSVQGNGHDHKCACGGLCQECRGRTFTEAELEGSQELPNEKPYPNEHACRIHAPDKYEKFRRTNKENDAGKTYGLIFGKLKGKDSWELQAMRFPKEDWTPAEARKACSDAEGSFEAASQEAASPSGKGVQDIRIAQPRGAKEYVPRLDGSWEWIIDVLEEAAGSYLVAQGVAGADDACVDVVGTFPDHAILCVSPETDSSEEEDEDEDCPTYWRIAWGMMEGTPAWQGKPEQVLLQLTVAGMPDKDTLAQLLKGPRSRISKRNLARLNHARDLVHVVRTSEELKHHTRANADRAHALVGEVMADVTAPREQQASVDLEACALLARIRSGEGPGPGTLLALREEVDALLERRLTNELLEANF